MKKSFLSFTLLVVGVALLTQSATGAVKLTALNSMERIFQHQELFGADKVEIAAAGNEVQSFQVVVGAEGQTIRVTNITLSALTGSTGYKIEGNNIRLYREEYTRVRRPTLRSDMPPGLYPDILVPFINPITGEPIEPLARRSVRWGEPTTTVGFDMYALPFEVFVGQNQPIWVDVHVPVDAPPGTYQGVVQVTSNAGKAQMPVTLTVWDFVLPNKPTHRNRFAHNFNALAKVYGVKINSDEFKDIEMRYCKAMCEHRLSAPIPNRLRPGVNADGSLKIDPEAHKELVAYMEEYRVGDFAIPFSFINLPHSTTGDDYLTVKPEQKEKALRYYRDYYNYVKENGWADIAYTYIHDEPNTKENYEQVLVKGAIVHEAAPELKCQVSEQTYPHDPSWPDIDPAVDIWVPLWSYIDRGTINEKLKNGDVVWSYTALAQRSPGYHPNVDQVKGKDPPYWHIDQPLLAYRLPTWINRQYNITGLLYWGGLVFQGSTSPWYQAALVRNIHFNGSGFMIYPGTPCGIQGPIASLRLKNLRDSMQDYEYMVLLEKKAGPDAVIKFVNRIAPEWWDFTKDPQALLQVRREMAEMIVGK